MARRKALDIKKEIMELLRKGELSIRELETKTGTNNLTIKTQLEELAYFGFIELIHHKKSEHNGREYTTVKLKIIF